jgi:hypothetical protein
MIPRQPERAKGAAAGKRPGLSSFGTLSAVACHAARSSSGSAGASSLSRPRSCSCASASSASGSSQEA